MEINRLNWDSNFFNREVFAVHIHSGDKEDGESLSEALRCKGAELAYIFLKENNSNWHKQLTAINARLFDEKVTYGKQYNEVHAEPPGNVVAYRGSLTDELLQLTLLSGHESRFKKDPLLEPHFESLYKIWIEKSLEGVIADKVFVYQVGDSIKGMVTCKVANGVGNIGLIATASSEQGKGIGKALIQGVDTHYKENKVHTSHVVTQGTNRQACMFYEKTGFTEFKKEYVYHWWFK
jgi:dTDP-4-amino-4,6-dideoxy-D-galactose acyltransferase